MKDWKEATLPLTATMKDAIDVLIKTSMRIVLIVDEEFKLLGVVTDGDIRRAMLKKKKLDSRVKSFMCNDPYIASVDESRELILCKMRELNILQIPVTDNKGIVVGLELYQIPDMPKFDNPVFIMAGGFGKRLKPLTDDLPKPMLKIGSKPILEIIIDQFISSGFHKFFISTHYKADMIKKFLGDGKSRGIEIQYLHENKPLGTAGSLGLIPSLKEDLPLLVMNADLLTKVDFLKLLKNHKENNAHATICVREYDFQVPYGVVESEGHLVKRIVEKPTQSFFVNAGIYVLDSSVIDLVNGDNYLDMPHLLDKLINDNRKVNMFPIHEYWLDIGHIDQFNKAQTDLTEIF